ncbi:nucleotidyltransferase family protein [Sphingomonas sp. MMS24-J45]|uniref:nucleotidyltransferase domain-containing protein n=1 Tax=Sphingomonas sp. MMS24-J45 TaxID=3238806 RepID=UPI003850F01B
MTAPDDPELRLAAACCRWPPSPARDAAVRAAAAGVDWDRFGRVVVRQRIAGLVEPGLRSAGVAIPEQLATPLARYARRIVHSNLVAAGDTARLTARIAAAGYPVLAVKGVVLGALAYGSVGVKHSKDIDLLIRPEHIGPVLALLEADGYRITHPAAGLTSEQRAVLPRYGKDVALVRSGPHLQIELHWRLFTNPALLPMLGADGAAQTVMLGTTLTAPTLAPADLYAYLVLHGAIDGWSRMKSLADLNALVAQCDPATLATWHDRAVALGAGPASEQALIMMRDLFALPLPPGLAETVGSSRRVRMLVAGAYRLMAVKDGATEIDSWAFGRMLSLAMQPLLGRGFGYQWQILRSVLYMQSDMYASKLPPSLYPLYPMVRVPAWLGSRISRAFRQVFGGGKADPVARKAR